MSHYLLAMSPFPLSIHHQKDAFCVPAAAPSCFCAFAARACFVLTGIGAGIGIGLATSKAVDAIARQPEAEPKIKVNLVLGCALAEATAIYGFVIALLIILMLH